MLTTQIQIPLELVQHSLLIVLVVLFPIIIYELLEYIFTGQKNNKENAFNLFLNGFRAFFYPSMIFIIFNGLTTSLPIYPEEMSKYILVPAEYIVSLPILALEGLAGIRYFSQEFIQWCFMLFGHEDTIISSSSRLKG